MKAGDLVKYKGYGIGIVIRGGENAVQVKYNTLPTPLWTSIEYLEKL